MTISGPNNNSIRSTTVNPRTSIGSSEASEKSTASKEVQGPEGYEPAKKSESTSILSQISNFFKSIISLFTGSSAARVERSDAVSMPKDSQFARVSESSHDAANYVGSAPCFTQATEKGPGSSSETSIPKIKDYVSTAHSISQNRHTDKAGYTGKMENVTRQLETLKKIKPEKSDQIDTAIAGIKEQMVKDEIQDSLGNIRSARHNRDAAGVMYELTLGNELNYLSTLKDKFPSLTKLIDDAVDHIHEKRIDTLKHDTEAIMKKTGASSKESTEAVNASIEKLSTLKKSDVSDKTQEKISQSIADIMNSQITKVVDQCEKNIGKASLEKLSESLEKLDALTVNRDLETISSDMNTKINHAGNMIRHAQITLVTSETHSAQKEYAKNPDKGVAKDKYLQSMETSLSVLKEIATSKNDRILESVKTEAKASIQEFTNLQNRETQLTQLSNGMSRMTGPDLSQLKTVLQGPPESRPEYLKCLTDGDVKMLTKMADGLSKMDTMIEAGQDARTVMTEAKKLMSSITGTNDGAIRSMGKNEATQLVQSRIASAMMGELNAIDTSSGNKAPVDGLKTKLQNFDKLEKHASEFNLSKTQMGVLKNAYVEKYCDAVGNPSYACKLSASEIKHSAAEVGQFLKSTGASESQIKGAVDNFEKLGHFVDNFGQNKQFDALKPDNKLAILDLYDKGALETQSPECNGFIAKLGSYIAEAGNADTWISDVSNGDYQSLRLIVDTPSRGEPKPTRESRVGNDLFDNVILKLGAAGEEKNPKVERGTTVLKHQLHNLTNTLSKSLNMGVKSFKFDEKTTQVIVDHFGAKNVNIILARIVDIQNKTITGTNISGEPSETTMAIIENCGLIPKGTSVEEFKASMKMSGPNCAEDMALFSATLDDFATSLTKSSELQELMANTLSSAEARLEGFNLKAEASTGEEQDVKTIREKFSDVSEKIDDKKAAVKQSGKNVFLKLRGKELASVSKYFNKGEVARAKADKLDGKIKTAHADEGKADNVIRAKELKEKGFPIGETYFSTKGRKTTGPEVIQMCQNNQIVSAEKSVLFEAIWGKFDAFEPSAISSNGTQFATVEDKSVSDALAEKMKFLGGTTFDKNVFAKDDLVPGKVKIEPDGKLMYVEITRSPGGEIKETTVGQLTKQQAQQYLSDLGDSKKNAAHSNRANNIAQIHPNLDFIAPEVHSYLGIAQLAQNNDVHQPALATEIKGIDEKFQASITGDLGDAVSDIRRLMGQEIAKELKGGGKVEDIVNNNEKMAEIKDRVIQSMSAGLSENSEITPQDISSIVNYTAREISKDPGEVINQWSGNITLTKAASTKLQKTVEDQGFAKSLGAMTDMIGRISDGSTASMGWSHVFSADLSGLAALAGAAGVSIGAEMAFGKDIVIEKSDDGKVSITLQKNTAGNVDIGMTFFASISVAAGVGGESMDGVKCQFESPEKAAGFMAALRSGNGKLAMLHTKGIEDMNGKAISVKASLTANFGPKTIADIISILPDGAVEVGGSLKKEVVTGTDDNHAGFQEISVSKTVSYSHSLNLTVEESHLGSFALSDNRSFETEYKETQRHSSSTNSLQEFGSEQVLKLDINGSTYTNNTDGINIGQRRLERFVNIDALRKDNQELGVALGSLIASFNPAEQRISVAETLKPEAVFQFNMAKHNKPLQDQILADPKNFQMTISVISNTANEKDIQSGSVGVASFSSTVHTGTETRESITFDQSYSLSRELTHAKLGPPAEQARRSRDESDKPEGTVSSPAEANITKLERSQSASNLLTPQRA